jgi:hypothetical protein
VNAIFLHYEAYCNVALAKTKSGRKNDAIFHHFKLDIFGKKIQCRDQFVFVELEKAFPQELDLKTAMYLLLAAS